MGLKIKPKSREAAITLDKRLYRRESVDLAAAAFSGKAEFFIDDEDENFLKLTLQAIHGDSPARLRELAGEFLNEALNQDLRIELARENAPIIKLLTTQVLFAARGAGKTADAH